MRRYLLSILLIITALSTLRSPAQEGPKRDLLSKYIIQDSSFLPVRFYVGDIVELRMRLESPGRDLHAPSKVMEGQWLVVREVSCTRIKGAVWEVRIFFTTFRPGRHVLPDIDLGGIVLSDLKAETRSILEDKGEQKLVGPKGQLLLPGTIRMLILTAIGVLFVPPILLRLLKGAFAFLRRYQMYRQRKQPYSRLLHALNRLMKKLSDCDCGVFFTQISRLLREYISRRLDIPALTSTTLELQRLLPQALDRAQPSEQIGSVASNLIALLRRADYVRFGGQSASQIEMEEAVNEVSLYAERIEGVIQRVEP